MRFFTECGFESHLGHQQVKSEPCTVHNVLGKARFSLSAGHDIDRVSFTARGSPSLPYSGPPGPLDVGAVQRAIGGGGQTQEKARGTEERGRLERPQHQGQSQGLLATLHIAVQVLRPQPEGGLCGVQEAQNPRDREGVLLRLGSQVCIRRHLEVLDMAPAVLQGRTG